MRKAMLGATVAMLLLGGCGPKGKDDARDGDRSVRVDAGGNVSISDGDGLSIETPGFGGKLGIKGMKLGGEDMEIDGMKLYPGTALSAIDVVDKAGPDNGLVEMRFTGPGTPDRMAAYYADAGKAAGFRDIAVKRAGGGATFAAVKEDDDRVTIEIVPAAGGSAGTIRIQDGK